MRCCLLVGMFLAVCLVIAGCGSSGVGTPPRGDDPGETVTVGTLQVGVASAAGFKTLSFDAGSGNPIAFTAMYGTQIVRLQEFGHGRLAYSRAHNGNNEIVELNTRGGGLDCITCSHPGNYVRSSAAWSPNGSKIAYEMQVGDTEIYVMNADGTGNTNLTSNGVTDGHPTWSPDGSRIAFHSNRGTQDIYVMDADGTDPANVTNDTEADLHPAWSPDGTKIAFTRQVAVNSEICTMRPNGSFIANLTNNAANDEEPAWSPDGRQIAFVSDRSGDTEIYVMNADGSGQTALTSNKVDDITPAWSPNGEQIAFASKRGIGWELMLINADGSGLMPVPNQIGSGASPDWCPAASALRTLIGADGTDGGDDPPFGTERPLAVVGQTQNGMVSAMTIGVPVTDQGSIRAAALGKTGSDLAGLKITAKRINRVVEDLGPGAAPRAWILTGNPKSGAVLVFFSGDTGRVTSVMAIADTALSAAGAEAAAELSGGRIVLRGEILEAYDARRPERNLISAPVAELALDARTGEVLPAG